MRRLKKKVIASALALATLFEPMLPMVQTSQALASIQSVNDNTLQVYLDAVQSAKERGVFQDRGVLFAVYDPYGKRLKMYHYWVAVGDRKDDGLTNTQCGTGEASINIIGALRLKDPNRKVDNVELSKMGYTCIEKPVGDRTLKYCTSPDKGSLYYDDDKSIVNVTPINGVLCRRQVNDVALKQANILLDGEGRYDRNNNVIYNVGQEDAAKIVAKYAYHNKIQYALFVVETYDVETEVKGKIKKKVIYHYYEVPKYYGIIAGINGGTPLGNGYYMVDGQGIGNRFDRSKIEIYTKTKSSGWSLIAVVLVNLVLIATGNIAAVMVGSMSIGMAALQKILDGKDIFNQPFLLPIGKDIPSPNRPGIDPTPHVKTPKLVEHISNDTNIIGGEGASQITERITWGNEDNQTLRGFKEPARERDAYQNWNKAPGGFIQLPSQ